MTTTHAPVRRPVRPARTTERHLARLRLLTWLSAAALLPAAGLYVAALHAAGRSDADLSLYLALATLTVALTPMLASLTIAVTGRTVRTTRIGLWLTASISAALGAAALLRCTPDVASGSDVVAFLATSAAFVTAAPLLGLLITGADR